MSTQSRSNPVSMWKRVEVLVLFLPAVLFLLVPYMSYAEDVREVRLCLLRGEYEKAEQVYQTILHQSCVAEEVREAQQQLIALYIASEQWDKAQAAYEAVLPDVSAEEVADTVGETAYFYLMNGDRQRSLAMYRYMAEQWSGQEYAVWPEAIELMSQIRSGNDPNSHGVLAQLQTKYDSGSRQFARAVNKIGNHYYDRKQYTQAIELFRYVIATHPEAEYAIWSRKNLIDCYLQLGDDGAVRREMDNLLVNVSGDTKVKKKVYNQLVSKFLEAGRYEWVLEYQQRVLNAQPFEKKEIWSHRDIAICHIELGDNEAAQLSAQTIISEYSKPIRQSKALVEIGDCYRRHKQYAQAQDLYQHVLSHWPQVKRYGYQARNGLAICDYYLGRQDSVQNAAEQLITEVVSNHQVVEANFHQIAR